MHPSIGVTAVPRRRGIARHSRRLSALAVLLFGVLFAKLAHGQTPTLVYTFTGAADGGNPQIGLVRGPDGNFYGATTFSQPQTSIEPGTLFQLTPSGTLTTLVQLDPTTLDNIQELIVGTDGNLYGVAAGGGPNCDSESLCGAIFKLTLSGALSYLYQPTDSSLGTNPTSLILGSDGNLYGTMHYGGDDGCNAPQGCGTIFELSASNMLTVLYTFTGSTDGAGPYSLIQGSDGNFYGTTLSGEASTVFKLTPSGTLTTLYTFPAPTYSQAGLVQGPDGDLYGTTLNGGTSSAGTIFRITPNGALTTLYAFGGTDTDPGFPQSALIVGSDGNLYGTSPGNLDTPTTVGSVFRISLSGTYSVLTLFSQPQPTGPSGGVIETPDGTLWGTLNIGGPSDVGGVFALGGAIVSSPSPTVTLSATPASINQGQSSTLSWSSTNATTCTASGDWSGAEATSGSQSVTPGASGTATYTLTCTGAEGSAQASATATITVTPTTIAFSGKAGGSGSFGVGSVLGLLLLVLARLRARYRRFAPCALLLASAPGLAQTAGFDLSQSYAGVRAGVGSYGVTPGDLDHALAGDDTSVSSMQQDQAAAVVYGGVPFFHGLGLELGFADLGVYHARFLGDSTDIERAAQDALGRLRPAGRGITLGLGGALDLNSWLALEPRLGMLGYQSRQEVFAPGASYARGNYGVGLDAGGSLLLHLLPRVYFGAGFECFDACNVRLISAELEFHPGR